MSLDRNDPEVIALLEEATTKATEALSAKNRELLGEVKALKAKAKGADIDPADHAALQAQVEELTDKLGKSEKLSKSEIEKLTKQLGEKDGALRKHLVDEGLMAAAVKAGVAPHYIDAVMAMHGPKVQVESKDGAYTVSLDGKSLAEGLTSWVQSDQGKHFAAAPANSGGGAGGGGGSGNNKPGSLTEAKTPQERKAVIATRLDAANKAAAAGA